MPDYRETLHDLNWRYKEAWDRAERLQDELNHIKKSRAYRLFSWWRHIAGYCRKRSASKHPQPFPIENFEGNQVEPAGTVSILIPFKDHLDLLRKCLRSLRLGTYKTLEIILLDNGSTRRRTLRYLERGQHLGRFKVVSCPGPFNFSRVCNVGARHARGDFLLFLNNDIEILATDWLEQLLRLAGCPSVGVVGATLLYPDGTLQHAGIFPQENGAWSHVYRGSPQDHPGATGELLYARTVPAVTGACFLIRRTLFSEMGGFNEKFGLTMNDVDLCCRVRRLGLKVAISPRVRLLHFESLSRGLSRDADHFLMPSFQ